MWYVNNHILDVYNQDYEEIIKKNYQEMLDEFYEIRLSIDLITIENEYFIILYNYFKGNIMAIFDIDSLDDSILNEKLGKYLNNPNIEELSDILLVVNIKFFWIIFDKSIFLHYNYVVIM